VPTANQWTSAAGRAEAQMSVRVPATTFGPQGSAGELDLWGISSNPNHITVTDNSALGLSAFWAAVTIISEAMATMPINVWRTVKSGKREIADQHPLQACLQKTTNGWQTPSTFQSYAQGCLLMSGNFVGEIVRNGRGQCVEIHHWLPRNTMYGVDAQGNPMYGVMGNAYQSPTLPIVVWKNYELPKAEWFTFPECLHLKGFSTDGYLGRSTIAVARQSLALGMTVEKFAERFFTHGRPAGFLKTEKRLSKDQRAILRQEWKEMHEGVQNALAVGLLANGLGWEDMGYSNQDAQFLQMREFQTSEVSRWFRISPHLLGDFSQVTEANLEQLMLELIIWTLQPWMKRWEDEFNLKCFTPMERFNYSIEFDRYALLKGDMLTQVKVDEANVKSGLRTPQEIRDRDGYNEYEDGSGKIPLVMASQLGSLKQVEDGTSPLQKPITSPAGEETTSEDKPKPKPKPKSK
jgi:HK97 family phage portal protein